MEVCCGCMQADIWCKSGPRTTYNRRWRLHSFSNTFTGAFFRLIYSQNIKKQFFSQKERHFFSRKFGISLTIPSPTLFLAIIQKKTVLYEFGREPPLPPKKEVRKKGFSFLQENFAIFSIARSLRTFEIFPVKAFGGPTFGWITTSKMLHSFPKAKKMKIC